MSGGFNVSTQQLRTHSSTVRGVANDIGTAAEAAGTERVGGLVYGVLFDAVAEWWMNMWAESLQQSLQAAQRAGDNIATGLSNNADVYDSADDGSKTQVTKAGGS